MVAELADLQSLVNSSQAGCQAAVIAKLHISRVIGWAAWQTVARNPLTVHFMQDLHAHNFM